MQNIPYNSTQNILNISQELGLTIPEAQALVNQGMRGVQQGPLDMLVKELSNKASADAYRQLQGQVFKQAPKNIPIGQVLGNLSKMTRPMMNVGIPVGDAVMTYEASRLAKQKMIEDYDKLPIRQKQLIGNHIGMNPRAGEDWKGLKLPLVQVNDNTPLLKGGVKYDDYILEPLGDDVYMQRMSDERFNN